MVRGSLALHAVLIACAVGLHAQQTVPSRGTASLAGRVVTMDAEAQPVRNAIVTLAAPEVPQGLSTMTDDRGAFAFANLPAGRFTITASKIAYITTAYGARRPGRPGTTLSLSAGQQVANLMVPLARGAVITGRVTDRTGQPVTNVRVMAIRPDVVTTRTVQPFETDPILTDDRGIYRMYGLEPGAYYVAVMRFTSGDLEAMSSTAIDAALAHLQSRGTARTASPGTSTAAARGGTPAPPAGNRFIVPATFYPGTARGSDAVRLTLAAGDERTADIMVEPVPTSTIEGIIATTAGSPLPALNVRIVSNGPSVDGRSGPQLVATPPTDSSGRFRAVGLAPGEYTVTASPFAVPPGQGNAASPAPQFAKETINLTGGVHALTLALRPMPSVTGRMVFSGAIDPPADVTIARVLLVPSTLPAEAMGTALNVVGTSAAIPNADGTFQMPNVMPGSYRAALTFPAGRPFAGWWLRSATVGGRDILDTLLDLDSAGVSDAVLTLTDRHTTLSGRVQTAAGTPVNDCFIIVFSTDRDTWKPGARRVQTVRPGTDGVFTFNDLPGGDYLMAALSDVDQDEWRDPAFLAETADSGAVKVTIIDGANSTQNLRLSR